MSLSFQLTSTSFYIYICTLRLCHPSIPVSVFLNLFSLTSCNFNANAEQLLKQAAAYQEESSAFSESGKPIVFSDRHGSGSGDWQNNGSHCLSATFHCYSFTFVLIQQSSLNQLLMRRCKR